jgi:GNAT superfamily N-acetyltransferase
MHDPGLFLVNIAVHPDYQKKGVGTSLYNQIVSDVKSHRAVLLRATCRADYCNSVDFLIRRGFERTMSIRELYLDLEPRWIDPTVPKLELENGIEIETMRSLEADPNRNRKLYDLVTTIRSDVPAPQPITAVTFTEFVTGYLSSPSRLPEATFVAVDVNNGDYVGISDLFNGGNSGMLAGLTGVRREYRKRGIANALKQFGFRYACSNGFISITSFSAAENAAIAAVNKRLGFVERYAWLHFEKHVSNE